MRSLALVLALVVGGRAAAVDIPPQAIHSPLPLTPWAAAGLLTPPMATVELTVGPRGLVTGVEVTSVYPQTSADAALREAVKETLGTWRFAPAIRDGKPAEAAVKMQIQFARLEPERRESHRASTYVVGFAGADDPEAAAREWRIDALGQGAFLEERKQALAAADALIPAARRREQDAPHFQVVTDASKPEVPAILAQNLEAVYTTLGGLFANVGPLERPRAPLTAYVFESERTLRQYVASVGMMPEAAGLYVPLGLVLFHLEMPSTESLLRVLMHETTHAFVDRYLDRRGVQLPMWLGEGLAEYVGNSDVEAGRLKPGSHKPYAVYHAGASAWRAQSMTSVDAATVKAAIKNGSSMPVSKLLGTSASRFYGKDWSLYYTESWLLVHFLRHGRPGWSEAQFPTFLLYAAEGFSTEDAVAQVYGLEGEALEKAYRDYVLKF
jgi:hypothetical protein